MALIAALAHLAALATKRLPGGEWRAASGGESARGFISAWRWSRETERMPGSGTMRLDQSRRGLSPVGAGSIARMPAAEDASARAVWLRSREMALNSLKLALERVA